MKTTILALSLAVIACSLSSCAKLYEDMHLEIIYRPKIEIDSLVPPDWEVIPKNNDK